MTLTDALEGEGAQAARTLEWLQWEAWLRVRHVAHSPSGLTATVLALTGRGDGAFAAYASPIESSALERQHHGQGRVAFRIRNALIQVTYEGNSSRAMPQNQAINGAYTAAAEVAATFTP